MIGYFFGLVVAIVSSVFVGLTSGWFWANAIFVSYQIVTLVLVIADYRKTHRELIELERKLGYRKKSRTRRRNSLLKSPPIRCTLFRKPSRRFATPPIPSYRRVFSL